MKNKQGITIPKAVLQSTENKFSWIRDIRNLSVGELVELYAYSEAIVETIREPLIILDKDLHIRSANRAFFEKFKYVKKDVEGMHLYDLNGGAWKISTLVRLLEDILPKNSHFDNFAIDHDFGRSGRKHLLLNARRIVLEKNKTQLILLAIEDITERKLQEKRKDEFISIVSHELRTPLTSLKAFIQVVQKRLAARRDEENYLLMRKAEKQTDFLTDLINQLLNLSTIEAGELTLSPKLVDIDAMIAMIVSDYQLTTDRHTLVVEKACEQLVKCDERRIEQVVTNLITNAIKYSPKPSRIIIRAEKQPDEVVVSVHDFGLGIAKKDLRKVFDRYFRTDEGDESSIQGFGLGLYISAQIIARHHGRIWVESTKGKGSTFFFSLPLNST